MLRHAHRPAAHRPAHRAGPTVGRGAQSFRPSAARRRTALHRGLATLTSVTAVLAGSVALAPTVSTALAATGVQNGTFETNMTGWVVNPSGSAQALARVSSGHSGNYAAQVSNASNAAATTVLNDSPNSITSTTAGVTYRATAWLRATQPNTSLVLRLLEFGNTGALATSKQSEYWATDTSWHQVTADLVAARTGSSIDLNALVWGLAPGKSFLVDDVSLAPLANGTPPPVSAPPVAAPPAGASGVLPAQGTGALFGYYPSNGGDPGPMESKIGRKFDLIHYYRDFDATNGLWPTSAMLSEASGGRTIHVGWELASYDGGYDSSLQPAAAGSSADRSGKAMKTWTYQQVTSGSLDRYLDAEALKIKAAPAKFIVDIDPEMDDRPDVGGTAKLRAAAGTRAQYAAAYRHIGDRFRARGVTNVVWAWTVSGWYATDSSKTWSLAQLWPGAGYVNIIMWDPYNHNANNWVSFSQLVAPFYNAIRNGVLDGVDTSAKRLPLGLAEYGCIADSRRANWLKAIPSQARSFPALVSLGYFSSGSWGNLENDSTATAALATAGKDSWLHPRG